MCVYISYIYILYISSQCTVEIFRCEFCCFLRNWMKKILISVKWEQLYIYKYPRHNNTQPVTGRKKNFFFCQVIDTESERERETELSLVAPQSTYIVQVYACCVYIPLYKYIYVYYLHILYLFVQLNKNAFFTDTRTPMYEI